MVRHDVSYRRNAMRRAPLAMLLARKGYKFLGVSRSNDADLRIPIEGGEPQDPASAVPIYRKVAQSTKKPRVSWMCWPEISRSRSSSTGKYRAITGVI